MNDKNRSCPQCKVAMDFRLGQFDCPNCGHNEAASQPKPVDKSSGPGFRSEQQWGGASSKPNVPPGVAPPPASGTVYSAETDHTFGREDTTQPKFHSSLQTEKHIYFGLSIAGNLINLAGGSTQFPGGDAMGLGAGFVGMVIGALLLAYVLYGSELWPKQCCMGCTGLQLVGMVGSLFFVNSMISGMGASGQYGGDMLSGGLAVFVVLVGVASSAWLIWILYRDVQYLK